MEPEPEGRGTTDGEQSARQQQLVTRLGGGTAEREAAYAALFELEAEHYELTAATGGAATSRRCREIADVAVASTIPLCGVLTRPARKVNVREYQRVSQLLVALSGVDPARVGGEMARLDVPPEQRAWKGDVTAFRAIMLEAKDSALGVVRTKDMHTLTAEDALTVATAYGIWPTQLSAYRGLDAMTDACGITSHQWLETSYPGCFLNYPGISDEDFNLAITPLLMEWMKTPPDELPDFTLVGILFAITHCLMAKPRVTELLLDQHEALSVFVDCMQQVTPAQLVSSAGSSHHPNGMAMHLMKDLIETAQATLGRDLTPQLLELGFIDLLLDVLRSVPEVGSQNCHGVVCVWGYMRTLVILHGEKLQEIEDKFREERNALRYLIDNNIIFAQSLGLTGSAMASICAANLFGKDEENSFGITKNEINTFIAFYTELIEPTSWGEIIDIGHNHGRALLQLCISDRNKEMLVECVDFVPHMIAGLLLDPNQKRQSLSQPIKSQVQRKF
jgi:hypothetical protein